MKFDRDETRILEALEARSSELVDRAVAWSQVVDYFEMAQGNQQRFVFFYLDHTDTRRRLELSVPRSRYAPFARLVREKIDARFNRSAQQVYGKKALEG